MSSKAEKAKEILISLIRAYLVQISVTVQKTNVNEHTMHKDVREEYVARLNGIWQSILPRQVGKYNDKLYRQIAGDLRAQFKKAGVWLVTGENLMGQINTIVLGEENPKSVPATEGDLVIFAKVLEFLSTGLFCNKTLMIDLANSISVTDMVPETKRSVNEAILKAMNDLKATFEQQRKGKSAVVPATPATPVTVVPVAPAPAPVAPSTGASAKLRTELEREYREFYTNLFSEKLKEYKEKVRGTLAILKQHNTELEDELAACYETNRRLAAVVEELGKIRPGMGDEHAFGLTLDKIIGDDEDEFGVVPRKAPAVKNSNGGDSDSDSEIEFAFGGRDKVVEDSSEEEEVVEDSSEDEEEVVEDSSEEEAEEEVVEDSSEEVVEDSSEEEVPPLPIESSESEEEPPTVQKKKPTFARRGPYGRR